MVSDVFPHLAMFSIGHYLFKPDDFAFFQLNMLGGSLLDMLLRAHRVNVARVLLNDKVFLRVVIECLTSGDNVDVRMLLSGIQTCNTPLRVLQRAVRRFCWARRSSRRLAVVMALHPRLGRHSLLACVGPDLVCHVAL